MRVLVTGASGTFGGHAAKRLLADGHEVVSIAHDQRPCDTASLLGVRDQIIWCRGDLLDATFVKRVVADYVVDLILHFAALPIVQVAARSAVAVFQTNILGTVHLLEAVKEATWSGRDVRMVFVSTDKVYGDAGTRPYTEDMPLNGLAPYEASKASADLICRTYASCGFAHRLAVVRPCNIVASADLNLGRILPRTIVPALRGDRPRLYRTDYLREFIAVEEAVDAILVLADRLLTAPETVHGRAFNIGSGQQRTMDEVLAAVLRHFPGLTPEWLPAPALARIEIPYQALDSSLIRETVGWSARTSFQAAVDQTVLWWRENLDRLPEYVRRWRAEDWYG